MMDRNFTIDNCESAALRYRLENHLTAIFENQTISNYLTIDGYEPEMQIAQLCAGDALKHPQIKLAFDIWLGMCVADRHSVLSKFNCLYTGLPFTDPGNRKTLIFCALFVHEFALILAEAMEWPD